VVTATTRPQRKNEVDGVDYFFVSKSRFKEMIAGDELIEHALVYGQYKGVPREQVRQAMASGKDVVMRLDVQGAHKVRQMAPQAVLIFLIAPSEQELVERLRLRHTESEEQLRIRLETARQEMRDIPTFDYVVPNRRGELNRTVDIVIAIITAEKHRTTPRQARL
jgi:guanylate kinase